MTAAIARATRGQYCAFVVVVLGLGGAVAGMLTGHSVAGIVSLLAVLVPTVGIIARGHYSEKRQQSGTETLETDLTGAAHRPIVGAPPAGRGRARPSSRPLADLYERVGPGNKVPEHGLGTSATLVPKPAGIGGKRPLSLRWRVGREEVRNVSTRQV